MEEKTRTERSRDNTGLILVLGVFTGVILLVSNLCATKLINFEGFSVDAGIIIYPLSYVVGDIMIAVSPNQKIPRLVIVAAFLANLMAAGVFYIAVQLPSFENWKNQGAFETVFGFAPRIVIASLAAFLISGFVNIIAFHKIGSNESDGLFMKSFGSSAIAKPFDIIVFEVIAYLGTMSVGQFVVQTVFAFGAGLLLELPLSLLACGIVKIFKLQPQRICAIKNKEETGT